jgi:hypothetical protein
MEEVLNLTPDEQIDIYRAIKKMLIAKQKITLLSLAMATGIDMQYLFDNLEDIITLLESASAELKIR